MKKTISLLSLLCFAPSIWADDITIESGNLQLTWSESQRSFSLTAHTNDGTSIIVFQDSKPKANYDNAQGVERDYITSDNYGSMTYTATPVEDAFGQGTAHTFTFTESNLYAEDNVSLQQVFYTYEHQPFMLTAVRLVCADGKIRSNHIEAVNTSANYTMYEASANNRMLKVPFDNDGFTRYHKYQLNTTMTSYEVTAIYAGEKGYGTVMGSVDHDHWKSGISLQATWNANIRRLQLISGMADRETRDVLDGYEPMSHGKVVGQEVSSARFLLGVFEDWRCGMETFADACVTVAGRNDSWTQGTPFGWQSWGVLADKNSYQANIEISDYYAQVLKPAGFVNSKGKTVMSLDANDGHTTLQKYNFIKHAKQNNQLVGNYATPLSLWWDGVDDNDDRALRIHGKAIKYDGAYCADPTHPSTQNGIRNMVKNAYDQGIRWIKADFVNAGMVQADSYYDKNITTAVEAYNVGMRVLSEECQKRGIFLALSISPLFPSQYGNSRRIACDTWGTIGQTEYAMNAISGGWWTDHLYQYNDPDHLVMVGAGDQGKTTEGENRARITSGAVTGMMLVADNFSPSDQSGRGNNTLSRQRAEKILMNADVNALADYGRSFRPVYGYKEYDGKEDHAENFFVMDADSLLYLAVFNYRSSTTLSASLPLSDLGDFTASDFCEVKELWTGTIATPTEQIAVSVPAKDARIYRYRRAPRETAVNELTPSYLVSTTRYDLTGSFASSHPHSIIVEKDHYSNGTTKVRKLLK